MACGCSCRARARSCSAWSSFPWWIATRAAAAYTTRLVAHSSRCALMTSDRACSTRVSASRQSWRPMARRARSARATLAARVAPVSWATSTASARTSSATPRSPASRCEIPNSSWRRRPPEAAHRDQRQGQLGVGPHLGDPVAAQLGPQQRPPAIDRGAPVGQHPLVGSPFGRGGPPLGRGRVAAERLDPGPEHGHRGIVLDQPVVVEPVEPALDGGQPAAAVDADGRLLDTTGDQVGIAGVHRVADRGLSQPVVLRTSGPPGG